MSFSVAQERRRQNEENDSGGGSSSSGAATTSGPFGGYTSLEDEERFEVEMVAAIHASIEG